MNDFGQLLTSPRVTYAILPEIRGYLRDRSRPGLLIPSGRSGSAGPLLCTPWISIRPYYLPAVFTRPEILLAQLGRYSDLPRSLSQLGRKFP